MSIERSKYTITKLAEFDRIIATDGINVEGGQVVIRPDTDSSSTDTGALKVMGGVGIARNLNVGGNTVITGSLQVNGTSTIMKTEIVEINDKNIELGHLTTGTPDDTTADGGGITLKGATDKYINWYNSSHATHPNAWGFSENVDIASGKFLRTEKITPRDTDINFTANLIPDTNNTYTIGSLSNNWKNGFFSNNILVQKKLNIGTVVSKTLPSGISSGTTQNLPDTTDIYKNLLVVGPGIPDNTTITSITGNDITISNAATAVSGSQTLEFYHNSIVDINGTDALKLPKGTTAERPLIEGTTEEKAHNKGYIRYNTSTEQFEGFGSGSTWGSLGGVIDVDQDTYIKAEETATKDNDELWFFTNNSERMRILSQGNIFMGAITSKTLASGITAGTSQTLPDTNNIYKDLIVTGPGIPADTKITDIVGNVITISNPATEVTGSQTLVFMHDSKLEISSTNAIKVPVGTTVQRPTTTGTETEKSHHKGYIRYNTTTEQFEGFGAGSSWGSLGGVIDVDQDTFIKAEESATKDNDELWFYTNSSERMRILSQGNIFMGQITTKTLAGGIVSGTTQTLPDTTNIYKDLLVSGPGIPANTTITNIVGNDITISNSATEVTGSQTLVFTHNAKLEINSTDAVKVPKGTTAERPPTNGTTIEMAHNKGYIRYNTTTEQFEGFGAGSAWGSLGGVMDVDQDTFIKAESSAGTDNDELWFYTDNTERMRILNNGNIGIGNDSPQNLLEVSGSLVIGTNYTGAFGYVGPTDGLLVEGNVGIGLDNPTTKLHVSGVSTFAGNIIPATVGAHTIGSTSNEWGNIYLSDTSSINFGDAQDVTLTHVANSGLQINSTNKIIFNNSTEYINSGDSNTLNMNAAGSISITSASASNFTTTSGGITLKGASGVDLQYGTTSIFNINSASSIALKSNDPISITHSSAKEGDDLTISQTGAQDASLILSSAGTGTDAIKLNATAGGIDIDTGTNSGLDIDVGTTGITIDTTGPISIDTAGTSSNITHSGLANGDLTIAQTGAVDASLILSSTGTGADALQINTSAGGIDITVAGAAEGQDLDLTSNTSINIIASEAISDAVKIQALDTAGGIDIDAGTAGITIDTTGPISLDTAGSSSNITHAGLDNGDLTIAQTGAVDASLILSSTGTAADALQIKTTAGGIDITVAGAAADEDLDISSNTSINVIADEATADAVKIQASNTAGGIDIDAGTGGIAIDTTGTLSLDSAGILNINTTADNSGITIEPNGSGTLTLGSDNNTKVDINALDIELDAGANGITLNTTGATDIISGTTTTINSTDSIDIDAGTSGITIDSTGPISIDTAGNSSNITHAGTANGDLTISQTGAVDASLILSSSGTASDALQIKTTAGGIDITVAGAAADEDLDLSSNTSINIIAAEAISNAVKIQASNVAGGIDIDAGTSGITLDATGLIATTTTNGNINFTTNTTGNILMNTVDNIQLQVAESKSVIINNSSNSSDLQVKTSTDTHALYVSGSTDMVAIGNDDPLNKLDIKGSLAIGATYGAGGFTGTAAPANGLIVEGRVGISTDTPGVSFAINTTDGLQLPAGTVSQRPGIATGTTSALGQIRYNSTSYRFEGYSRRGINNDWVSLEGISDSLGRNYITVLDTDATDLEEIHFYTGDSNGVGMRMKINTTGDVGIGYTTAEALGARLNSQATDRAQLLLGYNSTNYSSFNVSQFGTFKLDTTSSDSTNHGDILLMPISDRRVGIGITTPTEKLTVEGYVLATGIKFPDGTSQTTSATGSATNTFGTWYTDPITVGSTITKFYLPVDTTRVGIGHSVPDAKFSIKDTTLDQLELVYSDTRYSKFNLNSSGKLDISTIGLANNAHIVLNPDGNVGIGNITPSAKLTVEKDIFIPSNTFTVSGTGTGLYFNYLGATNDYGLILSGSNSPAAQKPLIVKASKVAFIDVADGVGIGTSTPQSTKKLHVVGDVRVEGDLLVNGSYSQIDTNTSTTEQWVVTNDGTGPAAIINQTGAQPILDVQDDGTSVLYVSDGGNVSLGTTVANTKFTISDAQPYITLRNSANEHTEAGAKSQLRFVDHTDAIIAQIQGSHSGTLDDTKGDLIFYTHDGTTLNEVLRIEENAKVGLGTQTPDSKMHIVSTSAENQANLHLSQENNTAPILKITGTSATADTTRTLVVNNASVTAGTIQGFVRCSIIDNNNTDGITDGDYYIPLYTLT